MTNPVIVEVTRGGIVESRHRGAVAVTGPYGALLKSIGDVDTPVFPRSAMKALQALPLVESGAAEAFGFTDAEIALACASHNGEETHVRTVRAMLRKIGLDEHALACGAQWPRDECRLRCSGEEPGDVHNNCSGKHAGMLALAVHTGADPEGYWKIGHPVQQRVMATISEVCDHDLSAAPWGHDGCSLPNWAIPLRRLSLGFSRLATGRDMAPERAGASERIVSAVRANPFMVAGTGRFCTRLMEAVPRAFVKVGAEGVYCACIPHAGIGIALKCDDGARRAAEVTIAAVLASLDVWTEEESRRLQELATVPIDNFRGIHTGEIRVTAALDGQ